MAFIKIVGLVYARRWKKDEQKSYGKMTVVYKANIKQHSNNLQNCTYKMETFTRFIAFQKKKKKNRTCKFHQFFRKILWVKNGLLPPFYILHASKSFTFNIPWISWRRTLGDFFDILKSTYNGP